MIKRGKRGLSPIIATVLLISISVILAGIIFMWAYSFIGESVTKQDRAIDQVCEDVRFEAEVDGMFLYVKNIGDIPLWGVEVREKNPLGDITKVDDFPDEEGITLGETAEIGLGEYEELLEGNGNKKLVISPVLLGETNTEKKKYICDEEFGQQITI